MSHYLLRKTKEKQYEIAKFEDTNEPTAVYSIYNTRCYCPAGSRFCKHIKILNAWKKDKEILGFVYNDEAIHVTSLDLSVII